MFIKAGCIDGEDVPKESVFHAPSLLRPIKFPLMKKELLTPSSRFVPEVELFTRSRVPWVPAIEGAKQEWGDFTN
jgi:hypothetical protein